MDHVMLDGKLRSFNGWRLKEENIEISDTNNNVLASTKTDRKGRFAIALPLHVKNQEIDLRLKLSREYSSQEKELLGKLPKNLFQYGQKSKEDVVVPLVLKTPTISLGHLEMENIYETEFVDLAYIKDIGFAAIPAVLQSAEEKLKHLLGRFDAKDIKSIQHDFNVSDIPLTAENTWKFITDGLCPIYFQKEGARIVAEINWNRYEFDKLKSLPNVKLFFAPSTGSNTPALEKIEVQFRHTLVPSERAEDFDKTITYTPSSANFKEGLRTANSVFNLYGQVVFHLGIGHIYGAKIAQLVDLHLKDTKLGELLVPHCRYIRTISNVLGEEAIFGTNGVLNCSGLSVAGISRRINDTIAALDPFSFTPREPINREHKFATAQKVYYQAIKTAIDAFVQENQAQICKEWIHLHRFFFLLHKSSPQYRPWDNKAPETANWQDGAEIGLSGRSDLPERSKYPMSDSANRSLRWIARNPHGPEKNDLEMVAAFITNFIHRVTFFHSWIHQTQFGEGGFIKPVAPHTMDTNFSPIAVEDYGVGPYGNIGKQNLLQQEETIKIFRDFNGENYTLLNDKEVHPKIVEEVEKIKTDLLNCGFDAAKGLHYSTVI